MIILFPGRFQMGPAGTDYRAHNPHSQFWPWSCLTWMLNHFTQTCYLESLAWCHPSAWQDSLSVPESVLSIQLCQRTGQYPSLHYLLALQNSALAQGTFSGSAENQSGFIGKDGTFPLEPKIGPCYTSSCLASVSITLPRWLSEKITVINIYEDIIIETIILCANQITILKIKIKCDSLCFSLTAAFYFYSFLRL